MASIATKRRRRSPAQKRAQAPKQKRRQARKAKAARRKLRRLHQQLPPQARALLDGLAGAFTRPTFLRFAVLVLAAILTVGGRTVCNLLRTLGALAPGHPSTFHRLFSKRRWSPLRLARLLAGWVLTHLAPEGVVLLAGDDTVEEHPGDKVYGKGCHRDPVRSTKSHTAWRWGHKWVVLAILVRLPFSRRLWALPVLVALCTTKAADDKAGRRHKTPQRLLRQLVCLLLRWFPQRRFLLAGDGNYGTHEVAGFCAKRRDRLGLVSKFYPNAALYEPAPPYSGHGRPRVKGAKRPSPQQVVGQAGKRHRLNVAWYGGQRRAVEVVSGTGQWYQAGQPLVAVRWVFVHDRTGTHRDEYLFTTDLGLAVKDIVEIYTGRWNIETTFEELRAWLGLGSTRGWKKRTVLRVAPCLLGLYTLVACLYSQLPARYQGARAVSWPGKPQTTFSDALTAVRRWLWQEWVFASPGYSRAFAKLPRPFRRLLLSALAPAA